MKGIIAEKDKIKLVEDEAINKPIIPKEEEFDTKILLDLIKLLKRKKDLLAKLEKL